MKLSDLPTALSQLRGLGLATTINLQEDPKGHMLELAELALALPDVPGPVVEAAQTVKHLVKE